MQENVEVTNTTQSPAAKSNNMMPIVVGIVVLIGLAIAGYVFAQGQKSRLFVTPLVTPTPAMETAATTPPTESPMTATASPKTSASPTSKKESAEDVKIVAVEAGSFYFKPNEIRVKKGQKVRIEMTSVSMMHDFVIDELNVRMPIVQNGNKGAVEFTADKVGTFEYYCSVMQHRKMGQVGKLIVE